MNCPQLKLSIAFTVITATASAQVKDNDGGLSGAAGSFRNSQAVGRSTVKS